MPSDTVAYKGQRYYPLKKKANASGFLFRDPEFGPTTKSLFCNRPRSTNIEWKRPKEICDNPRLFVNGVNSTDLIQGELGNCWLVAAVCCLSVHKFLWEKVIVNTSEQEFDNSDYAGIFEFRFWRFGVWTSVVIDDLLPTINGRLAYCHSPSRNEFWCALLEKAYAKLYGCYEALDGGELAEALEDFTGGVAENYDISAERYLDNDDKKEAFFQWMTISLETGSLICVAIPAKTKDEMETEAVLGLTKGHAYAVTAIRKIRIAGTGILGFSADKLAMIRLRNPWGPGTGWRGPFSDGSPEWTRIMKSDRDKIGLTFADDGEFWMTFDDFCRYFVSLAVCQRVNTSSLSLDKTWNELMINGEWALPHRVGGCINNRRTFLNNPQFMFDMSKDDEVLIELTQKMQRLPGVDRETIGFTIMQVEDNRQYRVHVIMPVVASSVFRNSRSVLVRRTLPAGRYVVVVCTFEPGVIGSFLFRVYTGSSTKVRELVLDKPGDAGCTTCLPMFRSFECVTQIHVVQAVGLQRSDGDKDIEAYCEVSCEGETLRSTTTKKTANPEWNMFAIFYRRQPLKKPIRVDVFHHNSFGFDEYLGGQVYIAAKDVLDLPTELPLLGRDEVIRPGRLLVHITTSHNLAAV